MWSSSSLKHWLGQILMGANQDLGQGGNPVALCPYGRASQREVGRAQEMGNWSGSYHHFPGVRQQNQTSTVEWKGLGKKQCQSSGSEMELTWVPDPFTSYTISGT